MSCAAQPHGWLANLHMRSLPYPLPLSAEETSPWPQSVFLIGAVRAQRLNAAVARPLSTISIRRLLGVISYGGDFWSDGEDTGAGKEE
jgi:hypothetical protein